MIDLILQNAAALRETTPLGGIITFTQEDGSEVAVPCSMGADVSGLQRADNSAGFQISNTRSVVVRTVLLASLLGRAPVAGEPVSVQGRMESDPTTLVIAPTNGVESYNAILTKLNLYNPNV